MQVRSFEIALSSSSQPLEGDIAVPTEGLSDVLVPIQGSPDVWAVWHVPVEGVSDLASFPTVRIEPVSGDPLHLSVNASALAAEKRVVLRVYVLGQ
ncbi:MAG: hypothetical protein JST30_00620 [Armatimonadetes bacterium]|nr:hypothetical protein [Armatimonadota bacterium]